MCRIAEVKWTALSCMKLSHFAVTVSIEVENVTREEIQLSWTSSSNGSLYNISVMEGKKINTTTTNETKAVFKNLLPGHLYNISVAVSSCAEHKKTSVSVRTGTSSITLPFLFNYYKLTVSCCNTGFVAMWSGSQTLSPASHFYLFDSSPYLDKTAWFKQEFARVRACSVKFLVILYNWAR